MYVCKKTNTHDHSSVSFLSDNIDVSYNGRQFGDDSTARTRKLPISSWKHRNLFKRYVMSLHLYECFSLTKWIDRNEEKRVEGEQDRTGFLH